MQLSITRSVGLVKSRDCGAEGAEPGGLILNSLAYLHLLSWAWRAYRKEYVLLVDLKYSASFHPTSLRYRKLNTVKTMTHTWFFYLILFDTLGRIGSNMVVTIPDLGTISADNKQQQSVFGSSSDQIQYNIWNQVLAFK